LFDSNFDLGSINAFIFSGSCVYILGSAIASSKIFNLFLYSHIHIPFQRNDKNFIDSASYQDHTLIKLSQL
jgi:hypothetical protein